MANTLIAYFTWSGNPAHLAQRIQRITGGDLFHIRTQQPYPKSYPMTVSRAYKELSSTCGRSWRRRFPGRSSTTSST